MGKLFDLKFEKIASLLSVELPQALFPVAKEDPCQLPYGLHGLHKDDRD